MADGPEGEHRVSAAMLFTEQEMGDDSLRQQLMNRADYDVVWFHVMTEAGYEMEVLTDRSAERHRGMRANGTGLFQYAATKSYQKWLWGRKERPTDRFDCRRIIPGVVLVAAERKKERQVFERPKYPGARRQWMTPAEIDLAIDLGRLNSSSFAKDMAERALHEPHPSLTEKQRAVLISMGQRYRKQLAALQEASHGTP